MPISYLNNTKSKSSGSIFGGFCFALYPLSVSHSCDLVDPKDLVAASGGILLFFGIGAIMGPILAAYPMQYMGNQGFFYFSAAISLLLCLFTFTRIIKKTPTAKEDKLPFSSVPSSTPMASELDPRAESSEEKEKVNL